MFSMNSFCSRNGERKGLIGKHSPAGREKAMEINRADVAELVDARDLKSLDGNVVWVRVPPPAPMVRPKRSASEIMFMADLEQITIVPGLTFDALVAGKPGAPLVLLLHGFAESMHCWRAQVAALGAAGY